MPSCRFLFFILICDIENDLLRFSVKDTGIGILKKDINHIFDRFYRGSNIDEPTTRGTGLGLSIVKELIGLLGGEIGVESDPDGTFGNKGSTFHFALSIDNTGKNNFEQGL
jgi:signal transduction histidine kinase